MNKEQALQIIKNTIDLALKSGAVGTVETASAILNAWKTLIDAVNEKQ